ncbi:MAG: enoyl-CoA hydratase/isomerase family protein [Parvibaculaceae bacterium]|nr:enoyl-CoA hydratase/isomerase family protein [Parvibaculaceae bacterium]
MSDEPEILFEQRGPIGLVTLNRPKVLNALTYNMVKQLHPQLVEWAEDDAISAVVIQAAGEKAFCAGGDIRVLHDQGKAGSPEVINFYRDEYRLNRTIKRYPKPYVALMSGINMGGGVGVSVNGSHRVASERLTFAMPETGIGLFPDVGGTYFLPRCPGEVGMYLGLTGARLKVADAVYAGIADAFVPADRHEALLARFVEGEAVDAAIAAETQAIEDAPLAELQGQIDAAFSAESVDAILQRLDADGGEWATKTAETIRSKSPLSTRVAYGQIRAGAELDFEDCMSLEFRLTNRFMAAPDFYEGVRAVVIDKDQAPKWQPASLDAVTDEQVAGYFASLGENELTFD